MKLFEDARDFQIVFLGLFLVLGVGVRDFSVETVSILAILFSGLLAQFLANQLWRPPNPSLRSALISSLSLCLLLRANDATTLILAAVLSIVSKFIFRFRGKHFFNPSNFGIIAVLIFSNDAWVSPGQWGEEIWYAMAFIGAGAMVVRKVGRWDTTGAFLVFYAALEAARNLWLGWTWDVYGHRMMSGALLLFSFFMITDPRVIPDRRRGRIIWCFMVAALTFILRNYYFIPTALFWALFVLSPFTILFDRIWPAERFVWTKNEGRNSLSDRRFQPA